jgi:hypothetical protein
VEARRLTGPDGRVAHVRATGRAEGDLHIDGPAALLAARRARVFDGPWLWLRQVHGGDVVVVRTLADLSRAGAEADAVVTGLPDVALAVHTADCAPVAFVGWGPAPVLGVAHCGWRGLVADVVATTVAAMHAHGAAEVDAVLGPCVHVECYEFGAVDLATVVERFGDAVVGRTASGNDALDVPAAVRIACRQAGVRSLVEIDTCTACDAERYWSHRARGDAARQALVAWLEAPAAETAAPGRGQRGRP